MRAISGTIYFTLVPKLPVLSDIAPPFIRRYSSLPRKYNEHALNKNTSTRSYMNNYQSQRLEIFQAFLEGDTNDIFNLNTKRVKYWRINDQSNIIEYSTEKSIRMFIPSQSNLQLMLMTGHGRIGKNALYRDGSSVRVQWGSARFERSLNQ